MNSATNQSTSKTQTTQGQGELKRGLKSRHLTMISLGGTIGTGLFLASGGVIHSAGPGGALIAYAAIGIMVYFLMTSLAELALTCLLLDLLVRMQQNLLIHHLVLHLDGTTGITGRLQLRQN